MSEPVNDSSGGTGNETTAETPSQPIPTEDGFEFTSDYDTLSPAEREQKVRAALYDAATSGNVQAALQWLKMNPQSSQPPLTKKGRKQKRVIKPRKSDRLKPIEARFLEHYFDCDECRSNGTASARHAGYKGSTAYLGLVAHRLLKRGNIQTYVQARLASAALPLETVLQKLSDQALASFDPMFQFDGDKPSLTLLKAYKEGKLNWIQSISFHESGAIKSIRLISSQAALIALLRFHSAAGMKPEEPPVGEDRSTEDVERDKAQAAISLVLDRAKALGKPLTFEQAREMAAKHFPLAKDVKMISQANN